MESENELKEDQEVHACLEGAILDNIRFEEIQGQNAESFLSRFFVFGSFYNENMKKTVLRIKRLAYSEDF